MSYTCLLSGYDRPPTGGRTPRLIHSLAFLLFYFVFCPLSLSLSLSLAISARKFLEIGHRNESYQKATGRTRLSSSRG